MEWNPYRLSDKALEILMERAVKRFEAAKSDASVAEFDELTVLSVVRDLYEELRRDNEEIFLELAQKCYEDSVPHGDDKPGYDWLLALLLAYDPVTKYVYQNEVDRKRERLAEALNASPEKAKEFLVALGLWTKMTGQYADTVTYQSAMKAYKDAGIKFVRWVSEQDDRRCDICKQRHGKIYPIDHVPAKPHWGCRCHVFPLNKKADLNE